jgi:hypothetical protein
MPQEPGPQEIAKWHRWFAVEMNNCAWALADNPSLSEAQRAEMLDAAHASAMHWRKVGNELNRARSDMLLAQVHALMGNGSLAIVNARRSHAYVISHESPEWEIAFAHAILAHAACAAGEVSLYKTQYALAKTFGESISDADDREIFRRTFDRLPIPEPAEEIS